MTTLKCPKCRQPMPEDALDAGQCPACGFPIDGPLVLSSGARRSRLPLLALVCALLAGAAFAGYFASGLSNTGDPQPEPEVAAAPSPSAEPAEKVSPPPQTAPKPPEPKPAPTTPKPPKEPEKVPQPTPEPKKDAPRSIGVVMKVDPKIAPKRHFDNPDDTAALPDLNSNDRVVLTGRVRALRIGSVHGKGSIDASGLVAEEITVTGDLNGEAVVLLNAPNGKVTLGGYVAGSAKLTVTAPGGEVVVLASSGRLTGGAVTTVTAKRIDVAGKALGGAKLHATLTTGGSLKLATVDEGATVTYRKAAASDPPLTVEKGVVSGGAKVVEQ